MSMYHYALWVALTVLFIYQGSLVLKDRRNMLSPKFVVATGFFYFYVLSYLALSESAKVRYMNYNGYLALLVLAIISLIVFKLGFQLHIRGRGKYVHRTVDVRLLKIGIFILSIVSLIFWGWFVTKSGGFISVYGTHHGAGGLWEETSAYIYKTKWFLYPVFYLMTVLFMQDQLAGSGKALFIMLGIFLILDAWWLGLRGGWLRLLVIFALTVLFFDSKRKFFRKFVYISIPMLTALIILAPYFRVASYFQSHITFDDALTSLKYIGNPLAGSASGTGNELITASALVGSSIKAGTVDFGLKLLHPVINFVPRFIWASKPYYNDWSINFYHLIITGEGWVPAQGFSPTGLAGLFVNFSWFQPFVWFLLGAWGGILFRKCKRFPDHVNCGYFCGYVIGLIFCVTQTIEAGFYSWFFFTFPIFVLHLFSKGHGQRVKSVNCSTGAH